MRGKQRTQQWSARVCVHAHCCSACQQLLPLPGPLAVCTPAHAPTPPLLCRTHTDTHAQTRTDTTNHNNTHLLCRPQSRPPRRWPPACRAACRTLAGQTCRWAGTCVCVLQVQVCVCPQSEAVARSATARGALRTLKPHRVGASNPCRAAARATVPCMRAAAASHATQRLTPTTPPALHPAAAHALLPAKAARQPPDVRLLGGAAAD